MADNAAPPTLSVVMPVFNREALVAESLASLTTQHGVDFEIVVVDDGSTDATPTVLGDLAARDPRIRIVATDHKGVAAARNAGVAATRGGYVTFLDSDDICAPGKLARQVAKLDARSDIDVVVGHIIIFSEMNADFEPAPESMWHRQTDANLAGATFRRALLDEIGPFDEGLDFAEDIDFFFRILEAERPVLVEVEVALYYRLHGANMTLDRKAMHSHLLAAYHRSIVRRRRAGKPGRPPVFFYQDFQEETLFAG